MSHTGVTKNCSGLSGSGTEPTTNPKTNTNPNLNPKLTLILTLFSCVMLFFEHCPMIFKLPTSDYCLCAGAVFSNTGYILHWNQGSIKNLHLSVTIPTSLKVL